jgi:biopolymer transport protein ExbB
VNTVEAIKHLFLDTGASWVLWMLAGLSVVSVAIAIERLLFYRANAADLQALASELHKRLEQADNASTLAWLGSSRSLAARIAAAGLRLSDRGPGAVEKAMLSRTALEREALDRRLAFLGTLGNNAPFIGLFGTVIGVIQAFEELGHSAAGHAGGSGQVASGAVMSAIAEALVATAVGLAVALPAVAAYNYFQRRVEGLLAGAEVLSNLVLAFLSGKDG